MKTQSMLLAALASAPAALAHTAFTDFFVNGEPVVCSHLPASRHGHGIVADKTRVTASPFA
jgi:hypothetical protein